MLPSLPLAIIKVTQVYIDILFPRGFTDQRLAKTSGIVVYNFVQKKKTRICLDAVSSLQSQLES